MHDYFQGPDRDQYIRVIDEAIEEEGENGRERK